MDDLDAELLALTLNDVTDQYLLSMLEECYSCAVCGQPEGDLQLRLHVIDELEVFVHHDCV